MIPLNFKSRLSKTRKELEAADFEIICGSRTWKTHRVLLHLHSEVLGRAAIGSFKEAKEGKLDLSADAEHAVAALHEYLYTFDYSVPEDTANALLHHTLVCILADKYNIPDLKKEAVNKSKVCVTISDMDDLAEAVIIAYDAALATKALRLLIVEEVVTRDTVFYGPSEGSAFHKAMLSCNGLAVDIAQAAVYANSELATQGFLCGACTGCFSTEGYPGDSLSCPFCGEVIDIQAVARRQRFNKVFLKHKRNEKSIP